MSVEGKSSNTSERRIRIWVGIGSLSGGGAEKQCELLLSNLDPERFEVLLGYVTETENDPTFPKHVPLRHYSRTHKCRWDQIWLGIYHDLKDFKPDLVHVWLPDVITVPGAVVAWLLKIPVISSLRHAAYKGMPFSHFPRETIGFMPHIISKKIASNFPLDDEPRFLKKWWQRKVEIIPNGVDVSCSTVVETRKIDALSLLFVGRFAPMKRLPYLLETLARASMHDWHLTVYGGGSEDAEHSVRALADSLGISGKITFMGFNRGWRANASDYDYLIFPSTTEGMPNAVVEAMAEGLPVVGSAIPALKHIISHGVNGFLFETYDESEFLTALENLPTSDLEYAAVSAAAKLRAADYSVSRMVDRYSQLYESK
jgi:glycosyltransferase involved in cell wall biosynthesis